MEFFWSIALNHNLLLSRDAETNEQVYSGFNPDEAVLAEAAKEIGVEFIESRDDNYYVSINDNIVKFEIWNRFDFTPERKRSSIIVKNGVGQIKLYMKGADSVILKKIDTFSKEKLIYKTNEHLDFFAKEGCRTLCYSMKTIPQEDYDDFSERYSALKARCIEDRNNTPLWEGWIAEFEENSLLLGVTALEDLWQDNVKTVIKDFIEADINIWMWTGDKLDTAESIGYSCKLLADDTEVFKIREDDKCDIGTVLHRISDEINRKDSIKPRENKIKQCNYKGFAQLSKRRIWNQDHKIVNSNSHQVHNVDVYQKYLKDEDNNNCNNNIDNIDNIDTKTNTKTETNRTIQKVDGTYNEHVLVSHSNWNPIEEEENKIDENDKSFLKYIINNNCFNEDSIFDDSARLNPDSKKEIIDLNKWQDNYEKELKALGQKCVFEDDIRFRCYAILVEGEAWDCCMNRTNETLFYDWIKNCRSVICSRCSPVQKSKVVSFVKRHSGWITLAIGDGGNDINMIKEADVGVGLFGKEGSQAAYSSDFAFAQFQYLRQLWFDHGRFSLLRNSYFALYFFYKNIIFNLAQLFFAFSCRISGAILFDNFYLLGVNTFLSTVPIFVYCAAEEDIDVSFEENRKAKMLLPDWYKELRNSNPFSFVRFVFSILFGIISGAICYYFPMYSIGNEVVNRSGSFGSFLESSFCTFWAWTISSVMFLFSDTVFFNGWVILLHVGQILFYIIFWFVHNRIEGTLLGGSWKDLLIPKHVIVILCPLFLNFIWYYFIRSIERFFTDNWVMRVNTNTFDIDIKRKLLKKKLFETAKYKQFLKKFKRIYYSNSEHYEADNYVDKKIKDMVAKYKYNKDSKDNWFIRKRNNNSLNKKRTVIEQQQLKTKPESNIY